MANTRENIKGDIQISPDFKKASTIPDFATLFVDILNEDTTTVVKFILATAIEIKVSDIHLEPEEEVVKIRFRVDGMLQDVTSFSPAEYKELLSRIKLLSGIKLNVSDKPQNGRFSVNEVEVRVSSLPSEYGESLVLRVLNPENLIPLKELGLREDLLKIFTKEIKKPNGMIVVTGPTGSGKTTTLYSFLKTIQSPNIKIITIEDPIEYHLQNVSQTQVHPAKGYDFASGLKAIVRQDPDVILVGEMRDAQTVDIALQAALTGHLVLSTLHTNDAAGTISRLTSLKAKEANIADAITLIIAQRLVRTLCKKCAAGETITEKELAILQKELPNTTIAKTIKIFHAKGCDECGSSGYKGRIGIFEAIVNDDEIKSAILSSSSSSAIEALAIKKGMKTLKQDGFLKILDGITTIEEVERETG